MSLPDVLLSLLRAPMSGTDLARLFGGTIQHFWKTDLSQIYRALETLHREGAVESESVHSHRGPARKVYRLTERGRRRLADWIRRPAIVPPNKFEYLAQLFSVDSDAQPARRAESLLRSMREEAARSVAVLEAIDASMKQVPGYPDAMPAHLFYPWLTLRHGVMRRRVLLDWIDESLERLERRPAEADGTAGPQGFAELLEVLRELGSDAAVPVSDEA